MRAPSIIGIYLLMASAAPALRNNEPETWPSPNGKYAIKETFYGEGKMVRGIFVHTVMDRTAVIYPGGRSNPICGVESRQSLHRTQREPNQISRRN